MTNELEKTFFDTFGIVPKLDCKRCGAMNFALGQCAEVNCEKTYPQITDRILLELICIAHTSPVITFVSRDVKSLKEEVLMVLCNWVNNRNIKHQVRALFEENNNNDK